MNSNTNQTQRRVRSSSRTSSTKTSYSRDSGFVDSYESSRAISDGSKLEAIRTSTSSIRKHDPIRHYRNDGVENSGFAQTVTVGEYDLSEYLKKDAYGADVGSKYLNYSLQSSKSVPPKEQPKDGETLQVNRRRREE